MKSIITLLFVLLISFSLKAQTKGELSVTVTTSPVGGFYAPKNIVAIWIENEEGNFVKTLLAYANTYITHLNIWQAATYAAGSTYNRVDAITGPTVLTHATRICSWDGTNIDGEVVDDGNYTVWMELTDKNATGNYSSFSFVKSTDPEIVTPSNEPSFEDIKIEWEPSTISISEIEKANYIISPNPSSGLFDISGENISEIEIYTISGEMVYKNSSSKIDITTLSNGIYLTRIFTSNGIITKKIIKK